jgi:AraC-like DNA-binding protein
MERELSIAWVPGSSATVDRLRQIIPPNSNVQPYQDEIGLLAAIARGGIALTVVEAGGPKHPIAARVMRRVHEAFPQHPLVAWCDVRTIRTSELLDVARAGVQDIVRHDYDELKYTFARIFASATQRAAGVAIVGRLRDVIPDALVPVFEFAIEHADEHLELEALAAVFGVSRRTLHVRLKKSGLPPTRAFLTWSRLLVASALLDQPGHTLGSVSGQLGFADDHHLGTTLRRYTGAGVAAMRNHGVLDAALIAFRATVGDSAQPS